MNGYPDVSAFSMYKKTTQKGPIKQLIKKRTKNIVRRSKGVVFKPIISNADTTIIGPGSNDSQQEESVIINLKSDIIKKRTKNIVRRSKGVVPKPIISNADTTVIGASSNDSRTEESVIINSRSAKVVPKLKDFQNLRNDNSSNMNRKHKKRSLTSFRVPKIAPSDKPFMGFEWIITPIKSADFFKTYWEKSSVFINRRYSNYYQDLFTTAMLDDIIRKNSLFYTQNIDVVSYENGKRETHNPEGIVYPAVLWDYYRNKCSIRVLNPHTYCTRLQSLIALLQEFFGCMVGINAYLTPKGSQGFAPHYDDIEAFVLQLEGRKHWKLYPPLTKDDVLPRYSSKNFERHELNDPMKEVTLETGDLLYFPRGIIHEGYTDDDSHSLHITISVYQKTAYADLLEHALKSALTKACNFDCDYRKGLPMQYLKHTGMVNSQTTSSVRTEIINKVKHLITKLTDYISVDEAADKLGKQFMWDAMPPVQTSTEKSCMVHENSEKMVDGVVCNQVSITLDINVRLLSYYCLRVVGNEEDEDNVHVYYCTENAKYYHGFEQQFLVMDKVLVPALEFLTHSYPNYIQVGNIPLEDDNAKMQLVSDLWERGLLVTEKPLETSD